MSDNTSQVLKKVFLKNEDIIHNNNISNKILLIYSWCQIFAKKIEEKTKIKAISYDQLNKEINLKKIDLRNYDHFIVFPPVDYVLDSLKNKIDQSKIVYYFLGTEVLFLERGTKFDKKPINIGVYNKNQKSICEFSEIESRLKKVGFGNLNVLPLPFEFYSTKLPEKFTVGIYAKDRNVVLFDKTINIINKLHDTNFVVYGPTKFVDVYKKLITNKNVLYIPNFDKMEKIMPKISMFIRLMKSDGLSVSVLEYLSAGRKVVWNKNLDFGNEYIFNSEDVDSICNYVLSCKKTYSTEVNEDQITYMQQHYSTTKFFNKLIQIIKK
jgi:cellobiose-specific phosphotransferase system component IIB